VPEIALIGMGEDGCRHLGTDIAVGKALVAESLLGRIRGSRPGFVKLVFDRASRRLLGAQIVGDSATELVHLAAAWMEAEVTADVLASGLFNHPSLCDLFRIAAQRAVDALGPGDGAADVAAPPAAAAMADERWR
jgi:pyruvate/2-oxoglutarate dehydrogenase complex dihydrolipoamide dehydrogenase (E3) component